jgi:hypothetical protein
VPLKSAILLSIFLSGPDRAPFHTSAPWVLWPLSMLTVLAIYLNQFLNPYTSTLKMETTCSSETSVSVCKNSRCHSPEYRSLNTR